jgi:hypothetical protein
VVAQHRVAEARHLVGQSTGGLVVIRAGLQLQHPVAHPDELLHLIVFTHLLNAFCPADMDKKNNVFLSDSRARQRRRWIEHYQQVTQKVTPTCRYFGREQCEVRIS